MRRKAIKSLLIEALDPADASAKQRMFLPVGLAVARARLDQNGEPYGGRRCWRRGCNGIETPGSGNSRVRADWAQPRWHDEEVTFRVPSPGYIDLTLVECGVAQGGPGLNEVRLKAWQSRPARRTFTSLPSTLRSGLSMPSSKGSS